MNSMAEKEIRVRIGIEAADWLFRPTYMLGRQKVKRAKHSWWKWKESRLFDLINQGLVNLAPLSIHPF